MLIKDIVIIENKFINRYLDAGFYIMFISCSNTYYIKKYSDTYKVVSYKNNIKLEYTTTYIKDLKNIKQIYIIAPTNKLINNFNNITIP